MRLFERIGDIIAANLNDLVDRFEDPELMLAQAIREMETMIETATGGAARAIAAERLLGRDLAEHERKSAEWTRRAEQAVRRHDDDLARHALARAHEHQTIASGLVTERSATSRTVDTLRSQIDAMRAKEMEARRKLAGLASRRQAADNGRALYLMKAESLCGAKGFARFDRMHDKIERAELEAEALAELYSTTSWRGAIDPDSLEKECRIEDELAKIKERQCAGGPSL